MPVVLLLFLLSRVPSGALSEGDGIGEVVAVEGAGVDAGVIVSDTCEGTSRRSRYAIVAKWMGSLQSVGDKARSCRELVALTVTVFNA
jgi:hypothetical protein